jgi:hypothetical protein
MLILITGANTAYSGFPYLVNFVANDGFLPRQLTKRGHRLAFSNGIILLASTAIALVFATRADVNHLVAFYALGVFTGFTLVGFGMAKRASTNKAKGWQYSYVINTLSGVVSLVIVVIFAIVKFTEGAWVIIVITPIIVSLLLRLNRQYRKEQAALRVDTKETRATSIARHDVTVLVDSVDLATVSAIRYARSFKPRNINAVHFVIDDQRAQEISQAWAENPGLQDVSLELIDCPDRRIPNAAVDYAIRATANHDVELTLLLPRRSYSRFIGKILHDQTADEIAAPISQVPRVVATIVPFDVDRITSGATLNFHPGHTVIKPAEVNIPTPKKIEPGDVEPVSHYAEDITKIGQIQWRKRAKVHGRVTSIKTAPRGSAPSLQVEIWDETGGVSLQFLGRREIAGLEVGSQMRAEGMVGEEEGAMVILNPSYELLV